MPVQECTLEGKSGYRWGSSGVCYTHDGTDEGRKAAKQKAVKQALAIGGGKMPRENELDEETRALVAEARRAYADLETVDLEGVSLLDAEVEIHGVGSPPEGDFYSPDELRAMAQAAQELEAAGEWRLPNRVGGEPLGRSKLGHSSKQALLASDPTLGEMPAAGWITNQRVSEDGKRLLGDIKDVPAKVAKLIKARAYRTRSAELGSAKSQKTGKHYDWVVTGVAWLGGKMPAVRTLDDVVALYEAPGVDVERRFVQFDEVGDPDLDALRDAVADLGIDAARVFAAHAESTSMPKFEFTDEQLATLKEKLGVEGDLTEEAIAAAADAAGERANELDTVKADLEAANAKLAEADQRKNEADEQRREFEQVKKDAEDSKRRLFEMERDGDIEKATREGRHGLPADREKWEKRYESLGAETARELLFDLPVDENLVREFGREGDESDDDVTKAYEAEIARNSGVPVEELI